VNRAAILITVIVALASCSSEDDTGGSRLSSSCATDGGCIACGAQGNEIKVGEYCTPGGGECDDNGPGNAILCAADFREYSPPMCTRVCQRDDECGSDAVCRSDPNDANARACVPNTCLGRPSASSKASSIWLSSADIAMATGPSPFAGRAGGALRFFIR
jgi:hypothetical protein